MYFFFFWESQPIFNFFHSRVLPVDCPFCMIKHSVRIFSIENGSKPLLTNKLTPPHAVWMFMSKNKEINKQTKMRVTHLENNFLSLNN